MSPCQYDTVGQGSFSQSPLTSRDQKSIKTHAGVDQRIGDLPACEKEDLRRVGVEAGELGLVSPSWVHCGKFLMGGG